MLNGERLGKKLYEYRKKAGFSQEELAEKLDVSRQAVSKWECGESLPDTDNLISISKLYGVSLDELVENTTTVENAPIEVKTDGQVLDEDELEEQEEREEEAYYRYDDTPADTKRKVLRAFHTFPYPILMVIAFLVWGFAFDGWAVSWILFVTIPVYYSILTCVRKKKWSAFAYPVFVSVIYLFLGMQWDLWHPWWILYITVPIYYAITEIIDRK
ncbi:MAG: helix-turn-helix transcriptional regulator [Clostridia bacterium]|nr:helix-turn-helix transcriptional regulator [Clostridia bacterium]